METTRPKQLRVLLSATGAAAALAITSCGPPPPPPAPDGTPAPPEPVITLRMATIDLDSGAYLDNATTGTLAATNHDMVGGTIATEHLSEHYAPFIWTSSDYQTSWRPFDPTAPESVGSGYDESAFYRLGVGLGCGEDDRSPYECESFYLSNVVRVDWGTGDVSAFAPSWETVESAAPVPPVFPLHAEQFRWWINPVTSELEEITTPLSDGDVIDGSDGPVRFWADRLVGDSAGRYFIGSLDVTSSETRVLWESPSHLYHESELRSEPSIPFTQSMTRVFGYGVGCAPAAAVPQQCARYVVSNSITVHRPA